MKHFRCPSFSAGPCTRAPGWDTQHLDPLRHVTSHVSVESLRWIKDLLKQIQNALYIPETHRLVLIPGSATGAIECALWNLAGPRPMELLSWGLFSDRWLWDIEKELHVPCRSWSWEYWLQNTWQKEEPWGHDLFFVWCETAHGRWVGLGPALPFTITSDDFVFCDATSAAFVADLPWEKLDATAFSFQKALGSEGGIGALVLSPKAIQRLSRYQPTWPIPKLFRLTSFSAQGERIPAPGLFEHAIFPSTPSWLALHDIKKAVDAYQAVGGLDWAQQQSQANLQAVLSHLDRSQWEPWVSNHQEQALTVLCLKDTQPHDDQAKWLINLESWAKEKGLGMDFLNHPMGPAGLRLWCGPTVETQDLINLIQGIQAFS